MPVFDPNIAALHSIFQTKITRLRNEHNQHGELLQSILNWACRFDEARDISPVQIESESHIFLIRYKNSDSNYVSPYDQSEFFWKAKLRGLYPFGRCTYQTTQLICYQQDIILKLEGLKEVHTTHALRYATIHKLAQDGMSLSNIQNFVGHKSENTTRRYLSMSAI